MAPGDHVTQDYARSLTATQTSKTGRAALKADGNKTAHGPKGRDNEQSDKQPQKAAATNQQTLHGSQSRTDTPNRSRGPERPPRQKSKMSHGPQGHVNEQKRCTAMKATTTNDSVARRRRGHDNKTQHCTARTATQMKQMVLWSRKTALTNASIVRPRRGCDDKSNFAPPEQPRK